MERRGLRVTYRSQITFSRGSNPAVLMTLKPPLPRPEELYHQEGEPFGDRGETKKWPHG